MTILTPVQFESTFRYFDKDETNTLNLSEMIAALASLGIMYSEEDFLDSIYEGISFLACSVTCSVARYGATVQNLACSVPHYNAQCM